MGHRGGLRMARGRRLGEIEVRGLTCAASAERGGGGGQLGGEGRGGCGGGAERGGRGRIDMGARHGLPDGGGGFVGLECGGIGRRGGQGLFAALASQPAEEASQQRGVGVGVCHGLVLEIQLQGCLIEGLFAAAGEDFLGGFRREDGPSVRECSSAAAGVGLLSQGAFFGACQGAARAPVVQAVEEAAHEGEVRLHPLAGGVEGEGCGQVDGHYHHQGEDNGGTGQVEVLDHGIGEEASGDAFDGQGVTPEESAGKQADGGRGKDDPQAEAEEARHCGAGGALAHPAEAKAAKKDGQEEGGNADGL